MQQDLHFFSHQDLQEIVQRASTLFERLHGELEPCAGPKDEAVIADRLAKWHRVVAQEDPVLFARRLAWDGLDEVAARRALGPVRLRDPGHLPRWAGTLDALLHESVGGGVTGTAYRFLDPQVPIPFEEFMAPMAAAASRRLVVRAGPHMDLLAEPALVELERALLERMSSLCRESLQLEFSLFRSWRQTKLDRLFAEMMDEVGREVYDGFVAHMLAEGLTAFFKEYAVLARLIATVAGQWEDAAAELLERLAADLPAIHAVFSSSQEPVPDTGSVRAATVRERSPVAHSAEDVATGDRSLMVAARMVAAPSELAPITHLRTRLSDPHSDGRIVMILTFATGLQVVYKPKEMGLEKCWFDLLGWLNEHGAPLPLQRLTVLDQGAYGWVEFAGHAPCRDEEEAQRYFRRSGILLGLVYVLGGNDCHYGNVIARREQPVLVDLETVMHPDRRDENDAPGATVPNSLHSLGHSVLRSGLLPGWQHTQEAYAVDLSALGLTEAQETGYVRPRWRNINTDGMERDREITHVSPSANAPVLCGVPLFPNDYATEIQEGFEQIYHFLMERRDLLLAAGGPLTAFAEQRVRMIWRMTRGYVQLLGHALAPDFLRDGADRGVQLDSLAGPLLFTEEKPPDWLLLAAEREALERHDIPYFTASATNDGPDLAPGQALTGCFTEPCYARVLAHIGGLDETDLRRQKCFIRAALIARIQEAHFPDAEEGDELAEGIDGKQHGPAVGREELLREAIKLAEEIRQGAMGGSRGGVTWFTVGVITGVQKYRLQEAGFDLYGGACGIALFLAALEQVSGGAGFRDLALTALQPLRAALRRQHPDRLTWEYGIGGTGGIGGFVYALTHVAGMLGEPVLLEEAGAAAALITPARIAADRAYDLVGGAAGAVLGLLALHRATGAAGPLERAAECGRHLVASRAPSEGGPRAWNTFRGKMLAGLSHGAAGIAGALLRLYGVTGDTAFRDAAEEAILYEEQLFSPDHGNWADLRTESSERRHYRRATWCHGGPGIALARLGGLGVLDTPSIRRDIEAGLAVAACHGLQCADSLCCGNLGRVSILLEAGRRLGRPDLIEAARARAAWVVRRAQQQGSYTYWFEAEGELSMPGLFQGAAGIGYTLLDLAQPEPLPSVLLMA
jgi:type 2 lantibiotic biosynthesis protein LanM